MTHKHTPAPWDITHKHHEGNEYVKERDGYYTTKNGKRLTTENDEGKANAHLIAAAPELLEALEEVEAYFKGEIWASPEGYVLSVMQEAIAKAKGG